VTTVNLSASELVHCISCLFLSFVVYLTNRDLITTLKFVWPKMEG